ncbi:MAG: hypothetical protein Q9224_004516, partial [Gallowayella concinna]
MANTSPQVLYLRLGDETQLWLFDDMFKDLCSQIDANYSTIHAKSVADAQRMLLLPSLKVILVVDGGITIGKQHMALQKQLSAHATRGSTVLFCALFSGWVSPPNLARMFRSFGLSWEFGSYHRSTFYLSQKTNMKAVHLKNTPIDSRIYVPLEQSRTQSGVFAPSAVDQQQSPAVFSKHGSGWIGYIGDVNNEGASQALTMALL